MKKYILQATVPKSASSLLQKSLKMLNLQVKTADTKEPSGLLLLQKKTIGSDHAGYELKQVIAKHLEERNIEFKDYGTYSADSCDYAVYAEKTARAVADGECELGLLFCGTGVGISMAANKVRGIRACCCSDCLYYQRHFVLLSDMPSLFCGLCVFQIFCLSRKKRED